ncbi:MAG: hypothetical protein NDI88_02935 [Lysobacter sp.]|nr:hypothetical protein [Lysobacter sp.]
MNDSPTASPTPAPAASTARRLNIGCGRSSMAGWTNVDSATLPGAIAGIRTPHGSADAAWEDPTHVRPYFVGSFGFFSQPHYWRADYGYRGDWQPEVIRLLVEGRHFEGLDPAQCYEKVQAGRNLVREMVCEMRAAKPARECRRELIVSPRIEIVRVG